MKDVCYAVNISLIIVTVASLLSTFVKNGVMWRSNTSKV